jgi:hypothetical protein
MTKGARGFDPALFPNYTLTIDGINEMRRRTRRRVRSRFFTRTRTATRTFDLQLAIATLRVSAPAVCQDWNEIRTIPVVYGSNREDLLRRCPTRATPD